MKRAKFGEKDGISLAEKPRSKHGGAEWTAADLTADDHRGGESFAATTVIVGIVGSRSTG
ncbi:hypothetical protein PABG_06124 [Paracoccidioides brasiliensis Pb03]|nr:hypothetical protein PABG_06124 [Paracoccidioides brasiliensis Pb03]